MYKLDTKNQTVALALTYNKDTLIVPSSVENDADDDPVGLDKYFITNNFRIQF